MANQNVMLPDAVAAFSSTATAVPSPPPFLPRPPPRGTSIKRNLLKQLEIGSVGFWLEAMKASSPTQIKAASTGDQEKTHWTINHPSALCMFEEIADASEGKQIAVFLDYDGTLSPIVDDPDRAFMSESMRDAVRSVALWFPTAIVSGRARDKVYSFVRLPELYYAGSHGMDIKGPDPTFSKPWADLSNSEQVLFQPASEYISTMDELHEILVEKTKSVPGARVENNKFCLTVHFRCVEEKRWRGLAEQVESVLDGYPNFHVTKGRKVLEIRPDIKWDKGKALHFLLNSLGFADRDDVLPIYIGDDRTDEDAFKVLYERGQGFGILVSKLPKETKASYSLQDPCEVMEFLRRLVDWKQETQVSRDQVLKK